MRGARLLSFLVAFVLAGAGSAAAQRMTNFQLEYFEPRPAQHLNFLNLAGTDVLGSGEPALGAVFHYTDSAIVQENLQGQVTAKPIAGRVHAELLGAIGLWDWAELGLAVPVVYGNGDDLALLGAPGEEIDGIVIADPRLHFKTRLWERADYLGIGLALSQTLYIPAGGGDSFASDEGLKFLSEVLVDWKHGSGWGAYLNVGYLLRPKRIAVNYVSDDGLRWGLGLQAPTPIERFEAFMLLFGQYQLEDNLNFQNPTQSLDDGKGSPAEALGGARWRFGESWTLTGGFGIGASRGVGAPNYRVVIGLTRQLEEFNPFRDSDGDGIAEFHDDCPAQAEDPDNFRDDDGCPDLDNDDDGIEDARDKCPYDSEDLDDFADLDGCPELDNDEDGVNDERDECPLDPEDHDGYRDGDGCPDLDNDEDGIPDEFDRCPDGAETFNAFRDDDGCPDEKPQLVEILQLRTLPFETGRALLSREAVATLNEIAGAMLDHPEITLVQIEGYTDSRGGEAFNQQLSKERAESVRQALIARGVSPERLVAKGFGEARPLADNASAEGRAMNRRVEIRVLELNGERLPEQEFPAIEEFDEEVEP